MQDVNRSSSNDRINELAQENNYNGCVLIKDYAKTGLFKDNYAYIDFSDLGMVHFVLKKNVTEDSLGNHIVNGLKVCGYFSVVNIKENN